MLAEINGGGERCLVCLHKVKQICLKSIKLELTSSMEQ